uniref:LAGLIDADG endonuclease n=1 Tax=Morchella brunnea TaxID=1174671 RepID=A0A8K1MGF8_9PEZI|nr:LAGLIDADG endonuclease [Morchella brunnea]UBU98508.1 LAGLIDADG endonuclease [Morchella brunnea]
MHSYYANSRMDWGGGGGGGGGCLPTFHNYTSSSCEKWGGEAERGDAFIIRLHSKDIALLKQIQAGPLSLFQREGRHPLERGAAFFGVGNISIGKDGSATYSVQSIKDLINEIIPHFLKYPLNTKKQADFLLFKSIIDLMNYKEHFNADGLQEIVNIRASPPGGGRCSPPPGGGPLAWITVYLIN